MTIPDPIELLRTLLLGDTAVAAIAGESIFGGGLPSDSSFREAMPQAAVVVKPAGGVGRRGYERVRRGRVDTVCYGPTLKQSWELHLAVRELLELLERDGALVWAEIASDGANALDPVEQWPTCYASYTLMSTVEA